MLLSSRFCSAAFPFDVEANDRAACTPIRDAFLHTWLRRTKKVAKKATLLTAADIAAAAAAGLRLACASSNYSETVSSIRLQSVG